MNYSFIKPDAGPSPALDASIIQNNFSEFGTIFSNNHTALNLNNQGGHEKVILELQSADPGVSQDLAVLYAKNATSNLGTQPQLFVQIPKFLPNQNDPNLVENVGMQLTYNTVNTAGPLFQSFLAGGYLIYFSSTSNIAVNITLSPAPTQILMVIATPNNTTGGINPLPFDVSVQIINSNTFKINSASATGVYTFGWVAIAKA